MDVWMMKKKTSGIRGCENQLEMYAQSRSSAWQVAASERSKIADAEIANDDLPERPDETAGALMLENSASADAADRDAGYNPYDTGVFTHKE